MTILQGDIKIKKTQVMLDVPEGGGAPTAAEVPDGASNAIFPDISEVDRAGGRINLRKVAVHVDTDNTDTYQGAHVIISRPPNDANVSVTLVNTGDLFDTRVNAANRIESYLTAGPLVSGYLMNEHLAGQRNIQIFQRPGAAVPNVARTLVLTYRQGQPDQRQQYVRVINREVEVRTFSALVNNSLVDYAGQVVTCELSDALRFDFPGSEPSRLFVQASNTTTLRDTVVADAGSYYGVSALSEPADMGAVGVVVDSVYSQLVPNSRTERAELDIRPAAVRNVLLQESPRRVEIGSSPHSRRLRIGQENRAFTYVGILRPLPAPGTLDVSYMALGQWHSLLDDGAGKLTGDGVGTINYLTGSYSVTLQALPDAGSAVVTTWGEKLAFTDRRGQAGFRPPEHAFVLENGGFDAGSLTIRWLSGGVLRTATDNGAGQLQGDATGIADPATGMVMITPAHIIDSGGEFQAEYTFRPTITDAFPGTAPDGVGFALLTTSEVPMPGTVAARWVTARKVSESSGGTLTAGSSSKTVNTKTTLVQVPPSQWTPPLETGGNLALPPEDQMPVNDGSAPAPGTVNTPAPPRPPVPPAPPPPPAPSPQTPGVTGPGMVAQDYYQYALVNAEQVIYPDSRQAYFRLRSDSHPALSVTHERPPYTPYVDPEPTIPNRIVIRGTGLASGTYPYSFVGENVYPSGTVTSTGQITGSIVIP